MAPNIPHAAKPAQAPGQDHSVLRFITCGSVDDGKSTLIGRLLLDNQAVLRDQLHSVARGGAVDLALLSDGLSAEREQGITIDVAWRYFTTRKRKFIMGDAPGHEQYTRNMVTAASGADAAVVLVDASKLAWQDPQLALLTQTRRHSLLSHLLGVPHMVFAINKLDAVADAALAYRHIRAALATFCQSAQIAVAAIVPISALKGWNVVHAATAVGQEPWAGYQGPTLLQVLHALHSSDEDGNTAPAALPVQWVEKFSSSSTTTEGRRVFWGRIASGTLQAGQTVHIHPGQTRALIKRLLSTTREPVTGAVTTGHSVGVVLEREVDVSRGDVLGAPDLPQAQKLLATVCWMDEEPLVPGRIYHALHGHRWFKAKVTRIVHSIQIDTLAQHAATSLAANAIGQIELQLTAPCAWLPYAQSRRLGAMILVDTASNHTAGALLLAAALD